jgi:uncharacterized delta-60 repeat protein
MWLLIAALLALPATASAQDQRLTTRVGQTTFSGITSLSADPQGRVVAAGATTLAPGDVRAGLVRYRADGRVDTAFSAFTPFRVAATGAVASVLQPDGKILTLAAQDTGTRTQAIVTRLNANGSVDGTFAGAVLDPYATIDPGFTRGFNPSAIAVRRDGKIAVAGTLLGGGPGCPQLVQLAVVQLNANGTLDTSFTTDDSGFGRRVAGVSGLSRLVAGQSCADSQANAIAVAPDGKLVVAGRVRVQARWAHALVRLLPDGRTDATFRGTASRGLAMFAFARGTEIATFSEATALAFDPGGRIVTTARVLFERDATGFAFSRTLANGSLDATFAGDGRLVRPGAAVASAVAVTRDGRIVAAGTTFATPSAFVLERLTPEGRLETTDAIRFGAPRGEGANALVLSETTLGTTAIAGGSAGFADFTAFALVRHQFDCGICSRFVLTGVNSGVAQLSARLGAATSVGILVERMDGRRVGRFPLGRHAKGRVRVRWPLTVDGRRLRPGRYRVTLRALRGSRVTALSRPVTIRIR